ncbi:MAG TPA: DMT family transporter [Verrucomicrobiae bacterium]|nr:DMT family transporter [Verrucomicrobiae bacterium]
MPRWLLYSILAALSWGAWGVVSKVAADKVPPFQNQVLSTLGLLAPAALAALVCSLDRRVSLTGARGGWWLAFLSGLTGALGNLAMLAALSGGGQAAVVSPLTAVYPLLTVLAAWWWLGEELQWVQTLGVALALTAMLLFNVQDSGATESQHQSWSRWMPMALLATLLFGATGLLQKLATNRIPAETSFVSFAAGFLPIAVTIVLMPRLEWSFSARDWLWATLGGALNGLGVLATLAAYRLGGKASVVTPLAALYPVVTVLLAVALLGERVGLRQTLAIALAVTGGIALSWERSSHNVEPA